MTDEHMLNALRLSKARLLSDLEADPENKEMLCTLGRVVMQIHLTKKDILRKVENDLD